MNPENEKGMKREEEKEEKEEEDRDRKWTQYLFWLSVFQNSSRLRRKCTARRTKENQAAWKKTRS